MNEPNHDSLLALGQHVRDRQEESLMARGVQQELDARFVDGGNAMSSSDGVRWPVVAFAAAAGLATVLVVLGLRGSLTTPSGGTAQDDRIHYSVAGSVPVPGVWHDSVQEPLLMDFSEGTRIVAHAGSRVQVRDMSPRGAVVSLERGKLEVNVNHKKLASWRVLAGPYTIEVTGTHFDAEWSPVDEGFQLTMHEGSVIVSGPQLIRRSAIAGEVVRVSLRSGKIDETQEAKLELDSEGDEAVMGESHPAADAGRAPVPRRRRVAKSRSWERLAGNGDYAVAFAEASELGLNELVETLGPKTLYKLADVARFAGKRPQARRAYEAVRRRFPGHHLATRASFDLGTISNGRQSIDWFEAYLRERPGGPLAREALGRLLEIHDKLGNLRDTRRLAKTYLARYPKGPHASLARTLQSAPKR